MVLGMEKVGQGNVFGNNLQGKQVFLDYKKSIFKWSQNYNLLRRLTHDLAHKLEVFKLYLFGQNSSTECVWHYST